MGDVPVRLVFRLRDTGGAAWLDQLGVARADGSFKPAAVALRDVVANPACPWRDLRIVASTTSPERGEAVTFTAVGYGSGGSYKWDLRGTGNYQTFTDQDPTVSRSWRTAGRRVILAQAYDGIDRFTAQVVINVTGHRPPVSRIRILPGTASRAGPPIRPRQRVRTRQPIVLNGQGSFARLSTCRVRNWQWDLELEDHHFHHYSGAVLGYRYRRPGRYRIRLTVTDTFGVKGRSSRLLIVTGHDFGPHDQRRPVVISSR
jgi:hypothetical protein